MTKRNVICPICESDLGKFHDNASAKPLRNHIFEVHKTEWKEILSLVNEYSRIQNTLKRKYNISHWDVIFYHNGVATEIEIDNAPPLSKERILELQDKIMKGK